jgi:predicted unusual protein kinase regulating ubiquinone biosynthesis (AarF/ABC1/UbiB family)
MSTRSASTASTTRIRILELSLTTVDTDEAGFLHEVRRKLPRYHWRPLSGSHTGEALADLQRLALRYGIRLPTSFALVGKTLAQADSIARTLDPELDPSNPSASSRSCSTGRRSRTEARPE